MQITLDEKKPKKTVKEFLLYLDKNKLTQEERILLFNCLNKSLNTFPINDVIVFRKDGALLYNGVEMTLEQVQNFKQSVPLSKLVIDNRKRIFLPDFGNIEIKLRPLEKTLFFLYLRHPDGIGLSFLCDYKNELYDIYTSLSSIGDLYEMRNRIDEMVNITSNSAVEKISKIKAAFVKAIGDELAKAYYIQGGNGEVKKLVLERSKLINEN